MAGNVSPIEWWNKDKFKGRVNRVEGMADDGIHITDIVVPDDDIVCDVCNDEIKDFPCPVVTGYALCSKCRIDRAIKLGDEEYFESEKYAIGDEERNPGVNCGGRKR